MNDKTIKKINDPQNERGAILVMVLILIFAVSLALMAYLYVDKNNILIASNLAVQNAAQEATDIGLEQANTYLQKSNPLATDPSYFYQNISDVPSSYGSTAGSTGRPVPPVDSFWTGCAQSGYCYVLPQTVQYGPYDFQVEYVIFSSPGLPVPESGYQISGGSAPTENDYLVYVHAQNASKSGLSVTAQAFINAPE